RIPRGWTAGLVVMFQLERPKTIPLNRGYETTHTRSGNGTPDAGRATRPCIEPRSRTDRRCGDSLTFSASQDAHARAVFSGSADWQSALAGEAPLGFAAQFGSSGSGIPWRAPLRRRRVGDRLQCDTRTDAPSS